MSDPVTHNAAQQRFEALVDGALAKAEYRLDGHVMTMTHTEVPPALEGRGLAAALVRAAFDHARAEGLRIDPRCAYVRGYMERHPETMDLHV